MRGLAANRGIPPADHLGGRLPLLPSGPDRSAPHRWMTCFYSSMYLAPLAAPISRVSAASPRMDLPLPFEAPVSMVRARPFARRTSLKRSSKSPSFNDRTLLSRHKPHRSRDDAGYRWTPRAVPSDPFSQQPPVKERPSWTSFRPQPQRNTGACWRS